MQPFDRLMKATDVASAAELLSKQATGRSVARFQVFGINSMKTLPDPAELSNQTLRNARVKGGLLVVAFDRNCIEVDLQRTGVMNWLDEEFDPSGAQTARRPTGRLTFSGSGVVEFVEPAKTKRISFWIKPVEAQSI